MIREFYIQAEQKKKERLMELTEVVKRDRQVLVRDFAVNFQYCCNELGKMQKQGDFGNAAYIEYTILRYRLLNRDYRMEVRVYGEEWYLDEKQQGIGDFSVNTYFESYDSLWKDLLQLRKSYAGLVSSRMVTEFMLAQVEPFFAFVQQVCAEGIWDGVDCEEYRSLKKNPEFEVYAGEYLGETTLLYEETSAAEDVR